MFLLNLICFILSFRGFYSIDIEVYYDTRSRYSQKVIKNSIEIKKEFNDIVNFHLYPVENRNNEWKDFITCQYEPDPSEIKLHICLTNNSKLNINYLEVIDCLMGYIDINNNWLNVFQNCSTNKLSEANIELIEKCYRTDLQNFLNELRNKILIMKLDFFPLIDINKKYMYDILAQGVLLRNMKPMVCKELPEDHQFENCFKIKQKCSLF